LRRKNFDCKTDKEKRKGKYILILNLGGKKGEKKIEFLEKEKNRKVNLLVRIPICTSRIRPARMLKFGVIA
jgi:hypothetical protein